jgi:hypothetical protein
LLGRRAKPRMVTESFIDRAVRTSTIQDLTDSIEESENEEPAADLETPAFIRKRLNNQ